jgi:hypothetical protein
MVRSSARDTEPRTLDLETSKVTWATSDCCAVPPAIIPQLRQMAMLEDSKRKPRLERGKASGWNCLHYLCRNWFPSPGCGIMWFDHQMSLVQVYDHVRYQCV